MFFAGIFILQQVHAQFFKENIYSDFVLQQRREKFDAYMREKTINESFSLPLDSNSEYRYESALWAISQFQFTSNEIKSGLIKLFENYDSVEYITRRMLLEVVYNVYPSAFINDVKTLFQKETNAKLFAMQALYLFRNDTSFNNKNTLYRQLNKNFPFADTIPVLEELKKFIFNRNKFISAKTPDVRDLFSFQQNKRQKTVYSFQRWNRDYPGMAVVQNSDGGFVRDSSGRLQVSGQLARSASSLPYFITNGNTPQGVYRITGMAFSKNNFIGPTPNLQLLMPFEKDSFYWQSSFDSNKTNYENYKDLLPVSWRSYEPMDEVFFAGKIGRTEIIAHGTTLDPVYFKDKPYYPFTPTLGCLCGTETWNVSTGRIIQSEQFNLANAFVSTEDETGYLFVINLDDKQQPVTRSEVEAIVNVFESNKKGQKNCP